MKQNPTRINKTVALIKYKHTIDSAKKRGKDFSLGLLYLANVLMQTRCAYSGEEFDDSVDGMVSLERIHNNIGYVDGNVIPVKRGLNTLRGSKSLAELNNELKQAEARMFELAKTVHDTPVGKKIYNFKKADLNFFTNNNTLRDIHLGKIIRSKSSIKKITDILSRMTPNDSLWKHYSEMKTHIEKKIANSEKLLARIQKENEQRKLKCDFSVVTIDSGTDFDKVKKKIKDLRDIINGTEKFENMSRYQKARVYLGLTIDSPFSALLKEKLVYNLLGGKL